MNNKKHIRIAQVIGKWAGGGVESVIFNYYKKMNHQKVRFDFICDADSVDIPYKEIEKYGGKVILVPPYTKLIPYIKELKRIFKHNKYDIVHSNINTLSVFPLYAAKKAGVPIRIAHSHSTSNETEPLRNIIKDILRPFSKIYATDYFACSEKAARYLFGQKCCKSGKIVIIDNAINLSKFYFDEAKRTQIRKKLGISSGSKVIGHIGRFRTQKNHKYLLEIFKKYQRIDKTATLILVGQGPLSEKIKKMSSSLGLRNVIFLGQIDNIQGIYSVFDIFVLPSLYEGLPVVGIEAQANGLPCIFADTITREAKLANNTIFLPLDNSDKWVKAIKNAKRAKDNRFSMERYDINLAAKRLERYYIKRNNDEIY